MAGRSSLVVSTRWVHFSMIWSGVPQAWACTNPSHAASMPTSAMELAPSW